MDSIENVAGPELHTSLGVDGKNVDRPELDTSLGAEGTKLLRKRTGFRHIIRIKSNTFMLNLSNLLRGQYAAASICRNM